MPIPSKIGHPDFSKLITTLEEGMSNLDTEGYPGKDFEHYVFEAALEALYGPNVLSWWNSKADY